MNRHNSMVNGLRYKAWLDSPREQSSSRRRARRLGEPGRPCLASFYFIDLGHLRLFQEAFLAWECAAEEEERDPRVITVLPMIVSRYEPTLTEDEAVHFHQLLTSFDEAHQNLDPCKDELFPATDVLWMIDPLTTEGESCVVPIPMTGYFERFCRSVLHRLKDESVKELKFLQTRGPRSPRIEGLKHKIAALDRMLDRRAGDSASENDDELT